MPHLVQRSGGMVWVLLGWFGGFGAWFGCSWGGLGAAGGGSGGLRGSLGVLVGSLGRCFSCSSVYLLGYSRFPELFQIAWSTIVYIEYLLG